MTSFFKCLRSHPLRDDTFIWRDLKEGKKNTPVLS